MIRGVRRQEVSQPVHRILVIELWQIGDVVLVTPFLRALRECFPLATITMLAKPHAAELLADSGLADDVIPAELPWTRASGKYSPSAYHRVELSTLVRRLRRRQFDLCFDARMDLRSNILAWASGARRRVGFRYGGGDWLLTDAVPIDPLSNHKVDDWLALLEPVGCNARGWKRGLLRTTEQERRDARATLDARVSREGPLVGIHPGGSHAGKRWPVGRFVELAGKLRQSGSSVIAFADEQGFGNELAEVPGVFVSQSGLRTMMAMIEQCDLLVCNDSGPMHVAAALGVPTVAIFERGEPRWFGPVGDEHVIIAGERAGTDGSAAPPDADPPNPVAVSRLVDSFTAQLARATKETRG